MIPSVSLFVRVGQRFCKPVKAAKKYKPQYAIIDGKPTHAPTGIYYLRYVVDGSRKWESVGPELDAALAAKNRLEGKPEPKETSTAARKDHLKAASPTPTGSRTVAIAVKKYLDGISLRKKPKTFAAYSKALEYFRESCTKTYLDEITPDDMLQYAVDLRVKHKHSARTVSNKFEHVMTFLKKVGIKVPIDTSDRPTFTEEDPETYEPEELSALFAACTPEERLLFRFFLMTGFREQEAMFTAKKNIVGGIVQVRHKPEWDWTPKAYKEREVPVHSQLIAELLAAMPAGAKPSDLIFITDAGKPDGHMLRTLKKVAVRAGLDPENCWLHKFRATFATTCLRGGADIRTVQKWLGHEDLASTMRYLQAARGEAAQNMAEAIWSKQVAGEVA